jgi:hypothetical protein
MFRRKICHIWLVILLPFALASCTQMQSATAIPPMAATPTVVAITPTETAPIPTNTPAPNLALTSSAALTSVPALPKEDAYRALEDLLKDNGGCQFPCLWGITPGKTSPLDAYKVLYPFYNMVEPDYRKYAVYGGTFNYYLEDNLFIEVDVSILRNDSNAIIKRVSLDARVLRRVGEGVDRGVEEVYGLEAYDKLLGAYSIESILSTYGAPSKVFVRLIPAMLTSQYQSETTLLYPDKGIVARYSNYPEFIPETAWFDICPSKTFVKLWLYDPSDKEAYAADWSPDSDELKYAKPIEEAAQWTVGEFYQFLKEPNYCFSTPLGIWPVP